MTNREIMLAYKSMQKMDLDAPLLTVGVWNSRGYRVKKGEKCKHKVVLWANCKIKKQDPDGQDKSYIKQYMKTACLFEACQVEKVD